MDERHSVVLIEALSRIWTGIRAHHPDVPPVILIPAPAQRGDLSVLGHFAALRWRGRLGSGAMHEVVVVAEHLDRPAEDVLETLLHEAAHALNCERGIHDCSKSQYHNRAFKAAAEEVGLMVGQVRHYGFALTTLPPMTAERYMEETLALRKVIIHRQKPIVVAVPVGPRGPTGDAGDDEDTTKSRSRKATCGCPFIIRVSKKTMADTTIRCESCGERFRLVE